MLTPADDVPVNPIIVGRPEVTRVDILRRVGFSDEDISAWTDKIDSEGALLEEFEGAARETIRFLQAGERLVARLPVRARRSELEQRAVEAIRSRLRRRRWIFLCRFTHQIAATLTDDYRKLLRINELLERASELYPGLVPGSALLRDDRRRPLKDKEGVEIEHALFLGAILFDERAGFHLIRSMQQPLAESFEFLERFHCSGCIDLGAAIMTRRGRTALLELRNQQFLNAEDDETSLALELGVDIVQLDPTIDVGVLRGAKMEHPRYQGRRVFSSGLNLTRLWDGSLSFNFFPNRELGVVNKIYRGLWCKDDPASGEFAEKPWIAVVDTFAIGGGCQLLLVMDHVVAEDGAYFNLPAGKEGLIPGVAAFRLQRSLGPRLARSAIFMNHRFDAGTPEAANLCDAVLDRSKIAPHVARVTEAFARMGRVSVVTNRRALREGEEPVDVFRRTMARYVLDQAACLFSPDVVMNLKRTWRPARRADSSATIKTLGRTRESC